MSWRAWKTAKEEVVGGVREGARDGDGVEPRRGRDLVDLVDLGEGEVDGRVVMAMGEIGVPWSGCVPRMGGAGEAGTRRRVVRVRPSSVRAEEEEEDELREEVSRSRRDPRRRRCGGGEDMFLVHQKLRLVVFGVVGIASLAYPVVSVVCAPVLFVVQRKNSLCRIACQVATVAIEKQNPRAK